MTSITFAAVICDADEPCSVSATCVFLFLMCFESEARGSRRKKTTTVTIASPTNEGKGNVKAVQHHLSTHMLRTKSTHGNFSLNYTHKQNEGKPSFRRRHKMRPQPAGHTSHLKKTLGFRTPPLSFFLSFLSPHPSPCHSPSTVRERLILL